MGCLGVCILALLSFSAVNAAAITNGELFDILKGNEAVEEYESSDGSDVISDNGVDTIHLQGEADDEADIGYLMDKLGFSNMNEAEPSTEDVPVVGGCTCLKDRCTCCAGRIYTITFGSKSIKTHVHACVSVKYVPSTTKFFLTILLNGHLAYHKEVSLVSPPKPCFIITYKIGSAGVCLDIYNVSVSQKRLCTRLIGVLKISYKKVYFSFGIACFKIPVMNGSWLTGIQQGKEVTAKALTSSDDDKIVV